MTGYDFADAVAARLGLAPLTDAEAAQILDVASVAAHSSERLGAPLCTFLAGRSGRSMEDVMAAVRQVAAEND